jgi:hypothetical protein
MKKLITACVLVLGLAACASEPPKPFVTGKETGPPRGCEELRNREGRYDVC